MTNASAAAGGRSSFDLTQPVWRLLTSVRFAVAYIGGLAFVGLLGVLIPQVPEAMLGNDAAVAAWVDAKRGTFGPLTDPMDRLGLFSVFHARWFAAALAFLVLNVSVCTFNRWSPTFRNVFHPPRRVPEPFYVRAHNRAAFHAVAPEAMDRALRSMRFSVRTRIEDGVTHIFADRFAWTQLATFISHLALILFIAGGLVTRLTGFEASAFAGEGTTVPVFAVKDPRQMQVRIDDAVGVYGERGNPLDFRTKLTIFRNGEEVKSGYTTVNDPLEYGGYRFHQVAFFSNGVALRIRDAATGNTVFAETFALQDVTAAPTIAITDAAGRVLLRDVIPPTDFFEGASGSLVGVPGTERLLWIGLAAKGADAWQVIAYDPEAGASGAARIDEGASNQIAGLMVRFEGVASLPAAVGTGVPGGGDETLAQLVDAPGGGKALQLVASGQPAITLTPGEPVVTAGYEYLFEGTREFAGISVKRDSGAWFIWVATGLLVTGLAITFYVPRRRLWIRLDRNGTNVAALAEKSGGFEKDMRTLAARLGIAVPPELQEER